MTAVDVKELLGLYALGVLEADEATLVERAVARDPALAAELAAHEAALGAIGAAAPPITPSPEVLTRLLASTGGGRFEAFSGRMAKLFDVTVDRAREILGLVDRAASWEPAVPGIALVHFDGGPAVAAADCGFVQIAAGGMFPEHTHRGQEVTLILSGRLRDVDGRVFGPGDELVHEQGTTHHLVVEGDEPCMYASRAMNGIEIGGVRAVPPSRQK